METNIIEYLSDYEITTDKPDALGSVTLVLQDDNPKELYDRNGKQIAFILSPVNSLEKITHKEIFGLVALALKIQKSAPRALILCMGGSWSNIVGIIMPNDVVDLSLTPVNGLENARELGTTIPEVIKPDVDVVIYGCDYYPEHPGYLAYQYGWPVPKKCPLCNLDLHEIEKEIGGTHGDIPEHNKRYKR